MPRRAEVPRSNYVPDQAWNLRKKKIELKRLTWSRARGFKSFVKESVWRWLRCARAGASVVIPSQTVVLFQSGSSVSNARVLPYTWTREKCLLYYRVVRQFAFGEGEAQEWDSATQRVMRHFQLPDSDWAELVTLVRGGDIMADAGIGPHLRCLIADARDHSWFTTKNIRTGTDCVTHKLAAGLEKALQMWYMLSFSTKFLCA